MKHIYGLTKHPASIGRLFKDSSFQAFSAVANDAEEVLLQKLLQSIMEKIFASFPVEDPAFHPVPPEDGLDAEDSFSSFPNLPRIRRPRKYAADANQQRHADAHNNCTKNSSTHPSLLPGNHSF